LAYSIRRAGGLLCVIAAENTSKQRIAPTVALPSCLGIKRCRMPRYLRCDKEPHRQGERMKAHRHSLQRESKETTKASSTATGERPDRLGSVAARSES
jgi:hypothetical protein